MSFLEFMVVVWAVVLVMVVVMLGVMVLVVVIVISGGKGYDGGGGEWQSSVVYVVGYVCGLWWLGAKVECAPAAQQERIPAA